MPKKIKLQQSSCRFTDHDIRSGLTGKKMLGNFINHLIFHYTRCENSLQYVMVNDEFLYAMNIQYLQHNTYTDIITFDLRDNERKHINGELYISIERVRENAAKENVPYHHELYRVIVHGALHLCGFDDKTKAGKEKMRALENEWLEKYLTRQKEASKIK